MSTKPMASGARSSQLGKDWDWSWLSRSIKRSIPGMGEEGAQAGPWGWVGGAEFRPSSALVVSERQ